MNKVSLSDAAKNVYKTFKDEYIEQGYMYSGSFPRNSAELEKVERGVLDELVDAGVLQVRDCEGYAFELSVKERGELMNRHSLASVWYEKGGDAFLADIQEEVKSASFVSRGEDGSMLVQTMKHSGDNEKPDVMEVKSPFEVGQVVDVEYDLRRVNQAIGYASRHIGPCGKETGKFVVADVISNLLFDPPVNMIELQSLCDKFNKLYPNERTMLVFEDVVLKRLKDRVPALDQAINAAAGEVKSCNGKNKEVNYERN